MNLRRRETTMLQEHLTERTESFKEWLKKHEHERIAMEERILADRKASEERILADRKASEERILADRKEFDKWLDKQERDRISMEERIKEERKEAQERLQEERKEAIINRRWLIGIFVAVLIGFTAMLFTNGSLPI